MKAILLMLGALSAAIIFVGCGTAVGRATGVDEKEPTRVDTSQRNSSSSTLNPNTPVNTTVMPQMTSTYQEEDFATLIENVNEILANQDMLKSKIKDLSTNQEDIASILANTTAILDDLTSNQVTSEIDITSLSQSIADLSSLVSDVNGQKATVATYDEIIVLLENLDEKISLIDSNPKQVTEPLLIAAPTDNDYPSQAENDNLDVSYGYNPDNPVTVAATLVLGHQISADSEYFHLCMTMPESDIENCTTLIYAKAGSKIEWLANGSIQDVGLNVKFIDSQGMISTGVSSLPSTVHLIPTNLSNGCVLTMEIYSESPAEWLSEESNLPYARYRVIAC